MRQPVIGVTGLPCTGKSYAAGLLAAGRVEGVPAGVLLKADDIGHDILTREDVRRVLRDRFGDGVVSSSDPAAIRRAIAARVFSEPAELAWLEALVHPLVTAEAEREIAAAAGARPVVIEAALLFAADLDLRCDRVLIVEATFAARLRRAEKRGWDREELEKRERRQIPLFDAAQNRPSRDRFVHVRNDDDDTLLASRIATALGGRS